MQKEMNGERIPMVEQTEQDGDLAYTLPVLVNVHVPGDGKKGTILKVDSGSSAPILFENRIEPLSWQQRSHAHRSAVAGNGGAPAFAVMNHTGLFVGFRELSGWENIVLTSKRRAMRKALLWTPLLSLKRRGIIKMAQD